MPIWECVFTCAARAATTSDAFNDVAEPRRREILSFLALDEHAVGDIVDSLNLEQPSVSKHLRFWRHQLIRIKERAEAKRTTAKDPIHGTKETNMTLTLPGIESYAAR